MENKVSCDIKDFEAAKGGNSLGMKAYCMLGVIGGLMILVLKHSKKLKIEKLNQEGNPPRSLAESSEVLESKQPLEKERVAQEIEQGTTPLKQRIVMESSTPQEENVREDIGGRPLENSSRDKIESTEGFADKAKAAPLVKMEEKGVVRRGRHEEKWQVNRLSNGRWVFRSAIGLGLGLLLMVSCYLFLPKLFPNRFGHFTGSEVAVKRLVSPIEPEDSSISWFAGGGVEIQEQALTLLKEFIQAETKEEKAKFLRTKVNFLNASKDWFQFEDCRLDEAHEHVWAVEENGVSKFLSFQGRTKSFKDFKLIFVRSEGEFLIDWEASVGWSSKKMEEIGLLSSLDSAFVRCVLSKGQLYNDLFPEKDYSCFMLTPRDGVGDCVLWGYVALHSNLDSKLKKLMNYGMFNLDLKEKVLVSLDVSIDPKRCAKNQLIINEVPFEGWVAPVEEETR